MYEEIISAYCRSCLNKKVNSGYSVEDAIRRTLQHCDNNNIIGAFGMIQAALNTLENEGGCQSCIYLLRDSRNKLQSLM